MRQLRARAAFLAVCLAANCAAAQGQNRQDFAPACASPNSRALDFWIGAWDVDWRMADGRSGRGASTVVLENGGCVIREHFRDLDGGVEGTGIYSYFAATGRWSQAWMLLALAHWLEANRAVETGRTPEPAARPG